MALLRIQNNIDLLVYLAFVVVSVLEIMDII